jgi:alkylation response protein AidB-like acyl-CoA dehydrogenase
MNFAFTEEQDMVRDFVERFVREKYEPDMRRKIQASEQGFSAEHWAMFAELGWLGLLFSEADGGFDGGAVETMILFEAFGRGPVIEPYLATIIMAGSVLRNAASKAQKEALVPDMIEGKLQMALAFAEPGGRYNLANVSTMATPTDGGFAINGAKAMVLNGPAADKLVIVARTKGEQIDPEGITLFLVDADANGVDRQNFPTQDGFRASEITFDNVAVDADTIIGELHGGHAVLQSAIDEAILAVSAEAVGAMEMLNKATLDFTKTRKQFGVPIGKFQVLQHRMAEMFMEYEQTKSLLYRAAMAHAGGADDASRTISALKVQVGRAGRRIGQEAIQIHGGMGMTEEMYVGTYFKRLTMIDAMFGNADYHLRRFAAKA